jgi:hypothetical protein
VKANNKVDGMDIRFDRIDTTLADHGSLLAEHGLLLREILARLDAPRP